MSVEITVNEHEEGKLKQQVFSVQQEDVDGLVLSEWLSSILEDVASSLVTLEDIEVPLETPMTDLLLKGPSITLNIIKLSFLEDTPQVISEDTQLNPEDNMKVDPANIEEKPVKPADETSNKREEEKKGLFKKFKSAASKMLIGSSSSSTQEPPAQTSNNNEGGMFGAELDERGAKFIEDACTFLQNPENQLEGLFRISGSSSAIKYFRATMDTGKMPSFMPVEDAHNVASLLKLYLRELAHPIMTPGQALLEDDPLRNRALQAVLGAMRKIDENKEITRMELPNLALVLGPNVIRDPAGGDSFEASADSSQIVLQMAEKPKDGPKAEEYCVISSAIDNLEPTTIAEDEEGEEYFEGEHFEDAQTDQEEAEGEVDLWSEMQKLKDELNGLKKELNSERQERVHLGNLILPQLERTQLDLIEALSSLRIEKTNETNESESTHVKPKTE